MDTPWCVASNIRGLLQGDGDFIFYFDQDCLRILVQTTHTGAHIIGGHLALPADRWKDCTAWRGNGENGYKIENFRRVRGTYSRRSLMQPPNNRNSRYIELKSVLLA